DQEFVYVVAAVQDPPIPSDAFAVNGLVDLLPLSPTRMLALERGFSTGVGNDVRLYLVDTAGATNVRGLRALPPDLSGVQVVQKTLLFNLDRLGITLDNLEGLTFGPVLPDGQQSLVIVSDNNFSPTQFTQFLAFSV
ncbi:MAG: esterase-like activity of phytase family protein, partial [Geodermatophilaceae bacterium]